MCTDQEYKRETKLNPAGKTFVPTRLRAGRCGVRIPAGARDLSLLVMLQTGCGPTSLPFQWVQRFFSGMWSGQIFISITHLHLVLSLKISVDVPPLSQYVFVVWTRTNLHFFLRKRFISIYLRVLISDSCSSEF